MYAALAVVIAALAACTVLAVRSSTAAQGGEQLRGFLYVGAAALAVLAVVVLGVGLLAEGAARAEGLALFGLFVYPLYLLLALVVLRVARRR